VFSPVRAAAARVEHLREAHPHFGEVIDHLSDELYLASVARKPMRPQPLLLAGEPGIGKTHFAQSVAEAVGTTYAFLSMDSAQSSGELAGSAKFWSNSQPGEVFRTLALAASADPIIVIDEIDKAPRHAQYDPLGPLHQLLEERTAAAFKDASVSLPLDARWVRWMATCNDVESLPAPVRSRFMIFNVRTPTPAERRRIGLQIVRALLASAGIARGYTVSEALLGQFEQATPREMRRISCRALAEAVRDKRKTLAPVAMPACAAKAPVGFS
jgi:ATP-dependent Lon protease